MCTAMFSILRNLGILLLLLLPLLQLLALLLLALLLLLLLAVIAAAGELQRHITLFSLVALVRQGLLEDISTSMVSVASSLMSVSVCGASMLPWLSGAFKLTVPTSRVIRPTTAAVDVLCKRIWPAAVWLGHRGAPQLQVLFTALMGLGVR